MWGEKTVEVKTIHPSIFYRKPGVYFQGTRGPKWGTPWAEGQAIIGHNHTNSHIDSHNLKMPVCLQCMSLDWGRKPLQSTRRTWVGIRCETNVLTTKPPCPLWRPSKCFKQTKKSTQNFPTNCTSRTSVFFLTFKHHRFLIWKLEFFNSIFVCFVINLFQYTDFISISLVLKRDKVMSDLILWML